MFQLKLVDEKSKEAKFARNALFSKHPEMKGNCLKINMIILIMWLVAKFQSHLSPCYTHLLLETDSYFFFLNNV